MDDLADVIVVGGGVVGLWTAYHLSVQKKKTILLEQELFVKHGGILHEHERVLSIRYISETKVEVVSSEHVYQGKSVIVTAGAYTNGILSTTGIELPLTVKKAPVLYWRDKSLTQKYSLKNGFPTTSMHLGNDYYSIPSYEYPGMMKICHEALISVDPSRRNALSTEERKKDEERVDRLKKTIKINFPDIDACDPVIQENCVITRTPDWRFIIDRHPKFRNIIIGAGFSAHGFKTAPTVGGMLANLAIGLQPPYSLKPFSIDRFNKSKL